MKRPKRKEKQSPLIVGNVVWLLKNSMQQGILNVCYINGRLEEYSGRNGTTRVMTVRMAQARHGFYVMVVNLWFFKFFFATFFRAVFTWGPESILSKQLHFPQSLYIESH